MVTAGAEWGEVYALLEGGEGAAEAFSSVRESWLVRGWMQYYARTGSVKALEQLARAPDLHARHILDALTDELAGDERTRARALATLAPLLARRPRWLHRVPSSLTREVARLARVEQDRGPRLHALLALCPLLANTLQPPPPLLLDLAAAVIKGLASQDPHLQVACHAAFQVCYWLSPGGILGALKSEVRGAGGAGGEAELAALLNSVRLHPGLVLTNSHAHSHTPPHLTHDDTLPPPASPRPPLAPVLLTQVSTQQVSLNSQLQQVLPLTPGADSWFSLGEQCGTESLPETPVPTAAPLEGDLPEPAVEATPENTPAKEVRQAFAFPTEGHSRAVRALRDESPGGGGGGGSGRLQRLVADRERATASPVSFTQAPPEHSVRPSAVRVCRAAPPSPRAAPRPASAPPPPPRPAPRSTHTQTNNDTHLTRGMLAASPLEQKEEVESASNAWARLDDYLTRLYDGTGHVPHDELAEQLQLTHAQLMYERSRREAHAERNRRLLGRCRQARGAELALGEARERVRSLHAELDELRARAARGALDADALHCDALEDELERERGARLRAEAALADLAADRDRHQAETQTLRALAAEATRRAQSLEHAAELAERRSETVKWLRREIVILGEREARLAEELRGRIVPPPRPAPPPPRPEPEPAPSVSSTRLNELESALATKDTQVSELKKTLLFQAEEQMARLQAMEDKYRALTHVLRCMETRLLRVGGELPEPPAATDTTLSWSSVPLQDLLGDDDET